MDVDQLWCKVSHSQLLARSFEDIRDGWVKLDSGTEPKQENDQPAIGIVLSQNTWGICLENCRLDFRKPQWWRCASVAPSNNLELSFKVNPANPGPGFYFDGYGISRHGDDRVANSWAGSHKSGSFRSLLGVSEGQNRTAEYRAEADWTRFNGDKP
jgi:hypothetical protein